MTKRRRSSRRRHDPVFGGRGKGLLGKLLSGTVFAASAVVGKTVAGYENGAVPQASVTIPGTSKALNVATFATGAVVSGFGPHSGMAGNVVQGFAGGLAGAADPVASSLGGGAMRPMGPQLYGSIGV